MHPALAVLIAVIVIAIIYLIVSGGPNKSFIDSVATAKTACDAAVASQKDADFVSAINAITAAKIARSASLNQYVNKPIPADVSAASTKLDGLMCRNHAGDV
jgi:beta-lactam-binding protein with PASTA domain